MVRFYFKKYELVEHSRVSLDMPNTAWDIVTYYKWQTWLLESNKKHRLKSHTSGHCLKSQTLRCVLPCLQRFKFNVSKTTKEHRPSRFCSNVIFLTLNSSLPVGCKQKFCYNCKMQPQKSNCISLKITLCALLSKISTSQNSCSDVLHDFY